MSLREGMCVRALAVGASVSAMAILGLAGQALAQGGALAADRKAEGAAEPYRGHKLVRVPMATRGVVDAIDSLDADVWTHTIEPMRPIELRLSPEQYARFIDLELTHDVLVDDLQVVVDAERARIDARSQQDDLTFYDEYRTLDEYWVRWQAIADINPDVAEFSVIGQSLEGRDMPGFVLNGNGATGKPVMLINSCQHAREWVSPAATTYLIEQLVTGYGTDARITRMLDELEWVFTPMLNPDGFDFTWTDERFWRKNRRDIDGSDEFGVDLNRNWSVAWGVPGGSSDDPGSSTYHGTGPFTEPELQTFLSFVNDYTDRVVIHLDIHTYGQLMLHPLGYSFDPSPDDSVMQELGEVFAEGVFDTSGEFYRVGQGSSGLYLTSGSAKDWAYGEFDGEPFGWTIELRPASRSAGGFDPDPDQILPTGRELTEGVLRMAERMAEPLRFHVTPQAEAAPAGETVQRAFEVRNGTAVLDPATVRGFYRTSPSEPFAPATITAVEGEDYTLEAGPLQCGDEGQFYLEAATVDGEVFRFPAAGVLTHRVTDPVQVSRDPVEIEGDWIAGLPDDTASRGLWALGDPEETTAQPEDDASPDGVNAWFTDPRAGGSAGAFDVDEGFTSLVSPAFDATVTGGKPNPVPYVSFALWYSNDQGASPGQDTFTVLISNDDGATWETLDAIGQSTSGWETKRYRIQDVIEPTATMRLQFIAADEGDGSLVEAGSDELVLEVDCAAPHPADLDRDGRRTLFDFLLFQTLWEDNDPAADIDLDGEFTIFDFLEFQTLFGS
ncbi:MAG: M14 family zinc carboxypeptidase [Phycisphaerales bacterium]